MVFYLNTFKKKYRYRCITMYILKLEHKNKESRKDGLESFV